MVKVKCTHRVTGRVWWSEAMPLPDALLWIAETQDPFCRLDFETVAV